ncbi:abortive infection family protein [Chloroflexia bacterium SDU3-3]|nr:abortive infection family protein [Chloroflexia bacterium SDU3-3]
MSETTSDNTALPDNKFRLSGCREILTLSAGAIMIERQVVALEEAVEKNPELAFDIAKALVETTCRTILIDRGHPIDKNWTMPQLFKETTKKLQFLPDETEVDPKIAENLRKTTQSFATIILSLAEIRNAGGFASHGKDAYDQGITDTIQAQFVARSADAIVHFLFRVHRNYAGPLARTPRKSYTDKPEFNQFIDDQHDEGIKILNLDPYKASEVLFYTDINAYSDLLAEYESGAFKEDAE